MEPIRTLLLNSKNKFNRFNQIRRYLRYQPIETKNVIKLSHKMTRVVEHKRIVYARKNAEREDLRRTQTPEHLIISCARTQFNHYKGQRYNGMEFNERNLNSNGWYNRKSNGDFFTINSYGSHPSLADQQDNITRYSELGVGVELCEALEKNFQIKKPSEIQQLAIEKIREHERHQLVVAETGGGKTLCYVIPIIEEVLKFKQQTKQCPLQNSPIAIVIVPTRELAFQLYDVFKTFRRDTNINFRVVCDLDEKLVAFREQYTTGSIDHNMSDTDAGPCDILITMPSKLKDGFRRSRDYVTSVNLKKLVIDEANLLLDDSNNTATMTVLKKLNLNLQLSNELDTSTQLVFVSATVPKDMKNILKTVIDLEQDEFEQVSTKNVNKLLLHVPQKFYRLSTKAKVEKLLETVKHDLNKSRQSSIMIFSNKVPTAVFVHKFLAENDVESVLFHSAIEDYERENRISRFLGGHVRVMSCTDIASRGLDTLNVSHVINYEMPQFIVDYVHRIGRVGRLSSHVKNGRVTNFITKAYEVDCVQNIESSLRKSTDLHNLNANITRILNHRYVPKKTFHNDDDDTNDDKKDDKAQKQE